MVITIGSVKGGVGKTTLAINFAIALAQSGQTVLLIDGDDQAHAMAFTQLREEARPDEGAGYTAMALLGPQIRTEVRKLKSHYDQVVIDVGGRDTASLRNALLVSDLLLVPAPPRSFELWGAAKTGEIVSQAREFNEGLRALAVLNAADPRGNDNEASQSALEEIDGFKVSPVRIGRRKAYPNAAAKGLGILEHRDDADRQGLARQEFLALFKIIYPTRYLQLERKIA